MPEEAEQGGARGPLSPGSRGGFAAALGSRPFRRLLVAQTVSSLGDWVATFAFIASAYALTRSQTSVAVVLVLRLVPPMFAAPVGGVVADRLPRRTVMVAADLSRAALVVAVPFVDIALLYAIALAHECISLFFVPARDAAVPSLVPRGMLPEANGLVLASSYGSLPVAAALFGALRLAARHVPDALPFAESFRAHPTAFAFLFDAATFVVSAALIAGLPAGERGGRGQREVAGGIAEGARAVLAHPVLRPLAAGLVVSMFGGGVLFAVGIAYVRDTLGGTDVEFGWLAALWGAGMALGLPAVRFVLTRGREAAFLTAVATCGVILVVMGLVPVLALAFAVSVAFGAAFSIAVVLALSTAQEVAEDRVRGRVMGAVQMLFRVGLGVGALGVGGLAQAADTVRMGFLVLDGNQVGLVSGGLLILAGAGTASGIVRRVTSPGGPPEPARA